MTKALGLLTKGLFLACVGSLVYFVELKYGWFAGLLACVVPAAVWWALLARIPPRHGAVVCNWWGGYREIGAGLSLVWWPVEWVDAIRPLDKADRTFYVKAETRQGDPLIVKISVGLVTRLAHLNESLLFGSSDERFKAAQGRLESLVTYLISRCDTYRDVYAGSAGIQDGLLSFFKTEQAGGQSLEAYYAVYLSYVTMSDISLRNGLEEAVTLPRIQEERGRALRIAMKDYRRETKLLSRDNPGLDKNQVLQLLMTHNGVIPQEIKVNRVEIGGDVVKELRRILGDSES